MFGSEFPFVQFLKIYKYFFRRHLAFSEKSAASAIPAMRRANAALINTQAQEDDALKTGA